MKYLLFFHSFKIPEITFLFGKEYNDDVILSGRDKNLGTVFLRIMNIKYHIFIAKIPIMSESDFEDFLHKNLPQTCFFEKTYMLDQTVSTIRQPYTFYKITGPKKELSRLTYMKTFPNKTQREGFGYAQFYRNNYLTPNIPPQLSNVQEISIFYKNYLTEFYKINRNQCKGIEYLLYPHLIYPFRNTKQDLNAIQNNYNINFFDTISIPDDIYPWKCNKYNCDHVMYVSIDQIHNAKTSTLQQDLGNYWSLMFDIENCVYISNQHNNQPPTTNMLELNEKLPNHSDNYYKFVSQFRLDKLGQSGFYDYNQITCISCIEQSFSGQFGQKISLININGNKQLLEQIIPGATPLDIRIKDIINTKFENQGKIYADKVIVCNTEKELLIELIHILSNHKYHIISHFNGWNFDERMIMSRMCLYDYLFEYYYDQMKTIRSQLSEQDQYMISYTSSYKNGTGMGADQHKLCMMKDGLKISFDVYQINLKDNIDSQKHDDNSLNGMLALYGLDLKGDVSYQELNDAFHDMKNQWELLLKGYWYCQRDSIQQCVLQTYLKQILNYVQFSSLCHISLNISVQLAVGQKIVSTCSQFIHQCNLPFLDIVPPNEMGQGKIDKSGDEETEERITNIGGEVICFVPGFSKYVSAVDASSMYPAQVEANNISNDCMLFAEDFIYILSHPNEFNIKNIDVIYIHEMYSPGNNCWNKIPLIDQIWEKNGRKTEDRIYYIQQQGEQLQKYFRYKIVLTTSYGEYVYEQFFYQKKDMCPTYNYVFYLQGKDPNTNQPYSPSSRMLTSLRFLRKDVKKQLKAAKTQEMKEFLDMKQGAIKIVMNGFYGAKDINCYPVYELIGPSAITFQSRCIIQNCREHLIHQYHRVNERIIEAMKDSVNKYHEFIDQVFENPQPLHVLYNNTRDMMKIPQLVMKYQDTDSNYFTMPILETITCKQRYIPEERYVKTNTFGLFNDVFRSFINACMNKFPLEFGFEGAFYRAWHIQKKMYLGYKCEQFVCHLDENGNIVHDYEIDETINLSELNPEKDNIDKYLKKHHIKITGLQLIKRNTTILLKRYYIKILQAALNQTTQNLLQYLLILLNEFKNEFPTLPQKQFLEAKKANEKDFVKPYVIQYNNEHPDQKIGLGTVIYTLVTQAYDTYGIQFSSQDFKVENYKKIISQEDFMKPNSSVYYGYYLFNLTKNLLTFISPEIDSDMKADALAKKILQENGLMQYKRNLYNYKITDYNSLENIITLYDYWITNFRNNGQDTFFDQHQRIQGSKLDKALSTWLQKHQYSNIPREQNYCNIIRGLFMRQINNQ